jgi:hypothetical protein
MNSDEQFSESVDKQMLIRLVNENVSTKTLKQNSKTPMKSNSLGFFLFNN